ncbi:MAG: methyltransferase domain-containing protein [Vicinamibacterales bacterium]|nr:methyltransferase domain-containing protein [Vicinamibacterales bacterium]
MVEPPDSSRPQPGRPSTTSQAGEFESARLWASQRQHDETDHHALYARLFQPASLDWNTLTVLDVGSGPLSVFEEFAPVGATVVPYDTLGGQYNELVPSKRFPIVAVLPAQQFRLVALLNCLDHMDEPAELLAHVAPRVAPDGRIWVYCNIDQPFDPALHPQDFRFWHLVALVSRFFDIDRCGLVREGRLFPYAWWAICRPRTAANPLRRVLQAWHVGACGLAFARFHAIRAGVKGVKLAGFRRFLPRDLQF